jgi:hypothetical protein
VWNNIFAGAKAGDGAVQESCYPYAIPTCPCNHHSLNSSLPKCPAEGKISTPTCDFTKKFACEDKGIFKADSVSLIPAANMEQELVENGPITVAYTVYDDFLTYKTGVYTKGADAKALGGHSVKIVGFGVDNATKMKYWTVANSWNAEWGDGGFFKIRRGTNVRDIADAREIPPSDPEPHCTGCIHPCVLQVPAHTFAHTTPHSTDHTALLPRITTTTAHRNATSRATLSLPGCRWHRPPPPTPRSSPSCRRSIVGPPFMVSRTRRRPSATIVVSSLRAPRPAWPLRTGRSRREERGVSSRE